MTRTTSRSIQFDNLKGDEDASALVIKLMISCNDLQLSNESLSDWKQDQPLKKKYRQTGAGMYFIRLQIGHLFEGLKILEKINQNTFLKEVIGQCDEETKKSFKFLEPYFTQNTVERKRLELIVGQIRHNLVFHYNKTSKLIKTAIKDRASREEAKNSTITRGSESYLWHFKPADDILDSIVVRQIWQIPRDKDLRVESDKISDEIHMIFLKYMDFSGEFIWKYFEK
ncbi:MAG: hypothetical protein LW823_07140 [Rickettsiales bacterium]|jgi:hypothetical protein|nr:hypothetical protein [Rickettsiales bacterium]